MADPHNQRAQPHRPRVGLLGATLGTGNLGVDALGAATVQGLTLLDPDIDVLYQSWTPQPVDVAFGRRVRRCEPLVVRRRATVRRPDGVKPLRRLAEWRRGWGSGVAERIGSLSTTWKALKSCDAVLDISAGDSFADIYGEEVFWYQSQVKLLCLDMGVPLVLLPQTIGPFRSDEARAVAAEILSRATVVGTREAASLGEIEQVCGPNPPRRVVLSPDLALLLEASPTPLPEQTQKHLDAQAGPLIAVNVSGLLYFGRRSFGLRADQAQLSLDLVRWALSQPGARVLLTPHVVETRANAASAPTSDCTDTAACVALLDRLTPEERQRVDLLEGADHPGKAKHAIGRCDFFVGARMHAFIGAASQATPGALLAYSKKAEGTTGTIGLEHAVVDLRDLAAPEVIAEVDRRYHQRDRLRQDLRDALPGVKERIQRFFHEDLGPLLAPAARRPEPSTLAKTAALAGADELA